MLEIETFDVLVETMSYVFRTVPWTKNPYTGGEHRICGKNTGAVKYLSDLFLNREIGGWCGLNCEFFKRVIVEKRFSCRSFNYGIKGSLTHITNLVKINKILYLFDPYFNRYYEFEGEPIPYKQLMELVNSGDTDNIKSVYGIGEKPIEQSDGKWGSMTGKELETSVISGHMEKGLREKMLEKFGDTNVFNLMKIEIPI